MWPLILPMQWALITPHGSKASPGTLSEKYTLVSPLHSLVHCQCWGGQCDQHLARSFLYSPQVHSGPSQLSLRIVSFPSTFLVSIWQVLLYYSCLWCMSWEGSTKLLEGGTVFLHSLQRHIHSSLPVWRTYLSFCDSLLLSGPHSYPAQDFISRQERNEFDVLRRPSSHRTPSHWKSGIRWTTWKRA